MFKKDVIAGGRLRIAKCVERCLAMMLLIITLAISGCGIQISNDLERAAQVLGNMLSATRMSRSCFTVYYPPGAPSDFVRFFFSKQGMSEWPAEDEEEFPYEIELIPNVRKPGIARQLVIKSDDAAWEVIAEGYSDFKENPDFIKRFKLPKAVHTSGLEGRCQG